MKESDRPTQFSVTRLGAYLAYVEKRRMMRAAAKHIQALESVCEIGPGRGHVLKWVKNRNANIKYTAIDQSDVSRSLLVGKGADEFIVANAPPVPLVRANMYVLMNILEHMATPDKADELIQQIHSNLTPGGLIVIQAPDMRFMGRWFYDFCEEHNYVTSLGRVAGLLEKHGFEVSVQDLYCGPLRLPLGYLLWVPSKILTWLLLFLCPKRRTTLHKIPKFVSALVVGRKP